MAAGKSVTGKARTVLAAAVLLAAFGAATSPAAAKRLKGVSEERFSASRWSVDGRTLMGRDGAPGAKALYRAAILAKAAGFPYIRIVHLSTFDPNAQGRAPLDVLIFRYSGTATIQIVGLHDPEAKVTCLMDERLCVTHAVDKVIAEIGAQLRRSPAEAEADIAALRAAD